MKIRWTMHIYAILMAILIGWYIYKMNGVKGCKNSGFFEFNKDCK